MSYVFTQKWRRDRLSGMDGYKLGLHNKITETWRRDKLSGLGASEYIGPDQPWTAQTASTWITQRTRQCEAGKEIVIGGLTPPKYVGGDKVQIAQCYATGRVKESSKPGYQRVQEWCCPVDRPTLPVTRNITQAEQETHAMLCNDKPLVLSSGQSFLTIPKYWLLRSQNVPSAMCRTSGVSDSNYNLLCCKEDMSTPTVTKDGKVYVAMTPTTSVARAGSTTQQIEEQTRQQAEQAARTEATLVASQEPDYGFWERYKWLFILGGGAIGLGFVAGLVRMALQK